MCAPAAVASWSVDFEDSAGLCSCGVPSSTGHLVELVELGRCRIVHVLFSHPGLHMELQDIAKLKSKCCPPSPP